MNKIDDQPVIILGPPRSGTSMTGGLLHILGVDLGNVRRPDAQNSKGYYEDIDFLKLIVKIFQSAKPGANGLRPPSREDFLKIENEFEAEIKKLLEDRTQKANGHC